MKVGDKVIYVGNTTGREELRDRRIVGIVTKVNTSYGEVFVHWPIPYDRWEICSSENLELLVSTKVDSYHRELINAIECGAVNNQFWQRGFILSLLEDTNE